MASSWRNAFVCPFTSAFEGYRGHPHHTVGRSIAAGIAAWDLNRFSMPAFALALHTHVSWSVFALILPIALLATFVPISANGIRGARGAGGPTRGARPRRAEHGNRVSGGRGAAHPGGGQSEELPEQFAVSR
jgi:hypothetical protein